MKFPQPVHYSREEGPGWKINDWETANKLLSYFGLKGNSFICFEKPDGSYFQCAGSKKSLTAEARLYQSSKHFQHVVFGRNALKNETLQIHTTSYPIDIDSSQELTMRHVRLLIRPWLEDCTFPDGFIITDVTARFSENLAVAVKT